MFLVNSRHLLLYDTFILFKSPPYPEVTELICRVPSTTFFRDLSIVYLPTSVRFYTIFYVYVTRYYISSSVSP